MTYVILMLSFIAAVSSGTCFGYVLVESQPFCGSSRDYFMFTVPVGIAGLAWSFAALWATS